MKASFICTRALLMITAIVFASGMTEASEPRNFVMHDSPKPLADTRFSEGNGKELTLLHFKGKLVLLNVWATWCVPCRKEMPTLDRLERQLGGPEFEVLALSMDRGGADVVKKFYSEIGIKNLRVFVDRRTRSMQSLRVLGLPTTLLLDRQGREIGRLIGPAEWDSQEMQAFLKMQIRRTGK